MKQLSLSVVFLSVFNFAFSQAWELFPQNVRSIFYDSTNENVKGLSSYMVDSIRNPSAITTYYFKAKQKIHGTGCNNTSYYPFYSGFNGYDLDSLWKKNDTIYYNNEWTPEDFYFLPKAYLGQSWTITSSYSGNDYNQITITCNSIDLDTVLGFVDSIKTFTFIPSGSSVGQIPINDFSFRLSKYHGVIDYIPFHLFNFHPADVNFNAIHLLGIDSAGIISGWQPPQFADFFHYQVGDILLWKRWGDPDCLTCPSFEMFYRDSITNVFYSYDSIIYTFNRYVSDSGTISGPSSQSYKFYRKRCTGLLNLSPSDFGYFDNTFETFGGGPSNVWVNHFPDFISDTITGDSIYKIQTYTMDFMLDTSGCWGYITVDDGYSITCDTRFGITSMCYTPWGPDCIDLIGAVMSGTHYGNTALPDGIFENSKPNLFTIFPNPANDYFSIRSTENGVVEIRNCVGELMLKTSATQTISTAGWPNGVYTVRFTNEKSSGTCKLVKN